MNTDEPVDDGALKASTALADAMSDEERAHFASFVERLNRRNPVRRIAEAFLSGHPISLEDAETLRRRFPPWRRPWFKERMVIAWLLGFAPADANVRSRFAEPLSRLLSRRPSRNVGCMFGCFLPHLFFPWVFYRMFRERRTNMVRAVSATSLGRLADPSSLSSLAEAVLHRPMHTVKGEREVRTAAAWALAQVLRNSPATAHEGIGRNVRTSLCQLMLLNDPDWVPATPPDSTTELSVLESLEFIGTADEIKAVELLLQRRNSEPRVRQTAERTLAVLKDRKRRALESATLLRPSNAPVSDADVLLRPAYGIGDSAHEQLLRPSSYDEQ